MRNSFILNDCVTDWRLKALLQFTFSLIPGGERLNYLIQRYVMRTLPASDAEFAAMLSSAQRHINEYQRFSDRPLAEAKFYEFGAGWDLTIPLALYGYGVEKQIVIDIRNLVRRYIFNLTIEKYRNVPVQCSMKRIPSVHFDHSQRDLATFLRKQYGIDYRAPCDARQTKLQSASIDYITSTWTFEHIPARDIRMILRECRRILRYNGLMSLLIDYDDHYSYFDANISSYNFLKFSDRFWWLSNPPLHYQNRMRHKDYVALFESEGFEVVKEQRTEGRDADLKTIEQMSISDQFKTYSLPELAVRNALILLRKRSNS